MKEHRMIRMLATWFGLGDLPKAPGTFGTLGAIPLYILLTLLRGIFPNYMLYHSFYFIFLMTFFAFSVYVGDICEREIFLEKDPQAVVIDEVLGYLTTLAFIDPVGLGQMCWAMGLAFLLFRLLDITKPGPIYRSQYIGRGIGLVLDDFLAGLLGNFILVCIWTVFF